MHKGMLMAIEKMRIVDKVNINDIKKIKRLINSIEKDDAFKENGKISFTYTFDEKDEIKLDCMRFVVSLFNWDLENRIFNPHSYGRTQFSKYLELARPVLELIYDVEGTWELNRDNIRAKRWTITISKNDQKEKILLEIYNIISSMENPLFAAENNTKYLEKMCLQVSTGFGNRYMNPFAIIK